MGAGSNYYSRLDPGARIWWTDIYMDITPARVMLGNASTWASSTHREIQIPVTWGASEITVTCNTGSFEDEAAVYLYVFDDDNNASVGFGPLTVSREYDPPPPATTITRPDSLKVE